MDFNPYELIYMSRMGDTYAIKALFHQYKVYFNSIIAASQYANQLKTFEDDLIQEMFISLNNAVETYREDMDASWLTFLSLVLKRKLSNMIRNYSNGHYLNVNMVELDAKINEEESVYDRIPQHDPFADPLFTLYYHEAVDRYDDLQNTFNETEHIYHEQMIKEYTYREGCAELNVEKRHWYGKMQRLKEKIKEEIMKEEE